MYLLSKIEQTVLLIYKLSDKFSATTLIYLENSFLIDSFEVLMYLYFTLGNTNKEISLK